MFREPRLESKESRVIQLRSVHDLAKYTYPEPSMRNHDDHNRRPLVAITFTTIKEGKKANSQCIHGFLSAQAALPVADSESPLEFGPMLRRPSIVETLTPKGFSWYEVSAMECHRMP